MKSLKRLMLAAVMSVTCIIMAGCGYDSKQGFTTDSPEDVARKFITAMKNCDFDGMKKYSTGSQLSDTSDLEKAYKQASSSEREAMKEALQLTSLLTVKSTDKTSSFWADGEDTCNVKVQILGEDSGNIKMKRKDIFSPWYVADLD